jgi:hypothetical protein
VIGGGFGSSLCGESGLAGEVVDCGLVVAVGGSESGWDRWVGVAGVPEFGQAGSPESLVDTPSPPTCVARYSCITSSLRCPFTKSTTGTPQARAYRRTAALNPSVTGANGAVGGDRTKAAQIADQTERTLQLRDIHVEIHPIDALHLEHHMIGQHISSSALKWSRFTKPR